MVKFFFEDVYHFRNGFDSLFRKRPEFMGELRNQLIAFFIVSHFAKNFKKVIRSHAQSGKDFFKKLKGGLIFTGFDSANVNQAAMHQLCQSLLCKTPLFS